MWSQARHDDRHPLSARLRDLRERRDVQQQQVARALGVSKSVVSGWENLKGDVDKPPTPARLRQIATFYASRTLSSPLQDVELDADEEKTRDQLLSELTTLTASQGRDILAFPPGERIRVICGELSADFRSAHAHQDSVNYVRMLSCGDLDSVVEIYGYLREMNPESDVQIRKAREIQENDPNSHLVVIGNLSREEWNESRLAVTLPVAQPRDDSSPDGEPFEFTDSTGRRQRRSATLSEHREGNPVTEDIGFLARRSNPTNSNYSMTIFSGVYTRGVYGAVRAITDRDYADANQDYIRHRFGESASYGLLIRVTVLDGSVPTPDFRDQDCIFFDYAD
jgi:transcriptional regulator with XRE-family HTH domain